MGRRRTWIAVPALLFITTPALAVNWTQIGHADGAILYIDYASANMIHLGRWDHWGRALIRIPG